MPDTYLKSKNKDSLEALCAYMPRATPVCQGRAAQVINAGTELEETLPACGYPDYFYVCLRAPFEVPAYDDVEPCTAEEGTPVCGVIG